jgi:hypothetical protein
MVDDDPFQIETWEERVEAHRDEAGRLAGLAAQATTSAIRQSLAEQGSRTSGSG